MVNQCALLSVHNSHVASLSFSPPPPLSGKFCSRRSLQSTMGETLVGRLWRQPKPCLNHVCKSNLILFIWTVGGEGFKEVRVIIYFLQGKSPPNVGVLQVWIFRHLPWGFTFSSCLHGLGIRYPFWRTLFPIQNLLPALRSQTIKEALNTGEKRRG